MEQNANALPKVTLGQYKGLEFTRRVRPVSEKAVELEAANLTRTRAPFAPVEKSAARGMRVTLDFEGFMDSARAITTFCWLPPERLPAVSWQSLALTR